MARPSLLLSLALLLSSTPPLPTTPLVAQAAAAATAAAAAAGEPPSSGDAGGQAAALDAVLRRLATLEGELAAVKEELATERRRAGPNGQQQGAAEGETPPPPANKTPLNVRDFGARGDGHHDDTAAFAAAIAAASKHTILRQCSDHTGGKGCGRSVPDVFVPAGEYLLSSTIPLGSAPGIHGEGTALLRQTNASADIFYSEHVWRWQLSGLWFVGGQNHLHLGTNNVDSSFVAIERCVFSNASSAAIRTIPAAPDADRHSVKPTNASTYRGTASTQVVVRNSARLHATSLCLWSGRN